MFEDTKEGDKVLVTAQLKTDAWGSNEREFLVPAFIDRTTKTQIIVSGIRFYRKNGREVTSGYRGGKCIPFDESRNQRKEYYDYKLKLSLRVKLHEMLVVTQERVYKMDMEINEMQSLIDAITCRYTRGRDNV